MRLYSMGLLDHIYLGLRPWTWSSLGHMLEGAEAHVEDAEDGPARDQARRLYEDVDREVACC